MRSWNLLLPLALFPMLLFAQAKRAEIAIVVPGNTESRIQFGVERLSDALKKQNYNPLILSGKNKAEARQSITIQIDTARRAGRKTIHSNAIPSEGFVVSTQGKAHLLITAADASGILYGCLELADRINSLKKLPANISFSDHPQMVLRGQCIGLQKPTYLPGRHVYEYPYTPETFPWFYDKALWLQVLDSMVQNRMNSLYLWNGHPFASLVKLKDYPYAVEVDDHTFKKNEEIFSFLTKEADKRGIWSYRCFTTS